MIQDWKKKPLTQCMKLMFIGIGNLLMITNAIGRLPAYDNQAICPTGMVSDSFANLDYSKLTPNADPASPNINQTIVGIKNESYLVVSNQLTAVGRPGDPDLYNSVTVEGKGMFMLYQNFRTKTDSRTVYYEFKNGLTNQPMPINNFSFSLFDVDTLLNSNSNIFGYFDTVKVKGKTADGRTIFPRTTYQGTITSSQPFKQTITNQTVECKTNELDGKCQVALTFDQPIVGFEVEYTNDQAHSYATDHNDATLIGNPAAQFIYIRFDSYCYPKQPRLTLMKKLGGNRINNTDQFTVQIKQGDTVVNNVTKSTTEGTGSTVTTGTGTTGSYKIDPTRTYKLTEAPAGTTDLSNYQATYECKNLANNQTITSLDPNNIKLNFGDEWECTVTNTPASLSISGTVFHDMGISSNSDTQYNGIFDKIGSSQESGIAGATVKLINCDTKSVIDSITTPSSGYFEFNFPANSPKLAGLNKVCLVETNASGYSNDTTTNNLTVNLSGIKTYPDNNFGDANKPLLALEKYQKITPCTGVSDLSTFTDFTKNPLGKSLSNPNLPEVTNGDCIAYKIVATNLSNIPLSSIIISDPLFKNNERISKLTANPKPKLCFGSSCTETMASDSVGDGQNGTVKTNPFNLSKKSTGILYFNTKYEKNIN